nr:50S ribosome-binding GTPase [Deltaproteobacteria bacterium]
MTAGQRSTLVGVATGAPDGGVAVVRISGPRAVEIIGRMVRQVPSERRLEWRRIVVGDGEVEHGLVVVMPGPRSFTGEDVVELHVHAGAHNVQSVVDAVLDLGATAAGAGDFSRRAFELGRLSLDEAEGIAAVIGAQTDAALSQARRLAAGELGEHVQRQGQAVLVLRAEIEANLDFPEDVSLADVTRWRADAAACRAQVEGWLQRFEAGRRARTVARVVLAGPPNAGKSSLFNALLGRARALVADTPGTTRDYVEAPLSVGRHGCVLVDTAGLRDDAGAIERQGVALSRSQVDGADVVLWIEAADAETTPMAAVIDGCQAPVITVESKRDRGRRRDDWLGVSLPPGGPAVGLDAVVEALARWFGDGRDAAWIGLARHRDRALEARDALDEALGHLEDDERLELAAFALGVA